MGRLQDLSLGIAGKPFPARKGDEDSTVSVEHGNRGSEGVNQSQPILLD